MAQKGDKALSTNGIAITNATIVDGTGRPPFRGRVDIVDGHIVSVAQDGALPGGALDHLAHVTQIDASGLHLVPGFIDTHIHSDLHLLADPHHAASTYQGVTTHILGQDGLSYAPLNDSNRDMYVAYLSALNGWAPPDRTWNSVAEFRKLFDRSVSVNTAYLVPHGAIRLEVMGMVDRPMTGSDMARAKSLLGASLEEGAVGFSTGLSYFPASYGDTDELIELCKIVAHHDGTFVVHLRSVFEGEPFDPLWEALHVARESGCKLHVSHYRTAPNHIGQVDVVMEHLDAAYAEGMGVTFDIYPYPYGSGHAVVLLPRWVVEGGLEATLERLGDPHLGMKVVDEIEANAKFSAEMVLTHVPSSPDLEGLTFSEAARQRGHQGPGHLVCELLLENRLEVGMRGSLANIERRGLSEQFNSDFLEMLERPFAMVGSDGIFVGRNPHPRGYGSFARTLRLARAAGTPLEKVVRATSTNAASAFRLEGRGTITEGSAADITLFDYPAVDERASTANGAELAAGIHHTIVNGIVVKDRNGVTESLPGKALAPSSPQVPGV